MNIKSVSKLIVALAVGCASERGWITDLDINICDVPELPQYPPITLRQLRKPNQAQSSFHLCELNVYFISVLLQEVTKKHLFDFVNEVLFQPLGIQHFLCRKSPQGYDCGGSDFAILAIEKLKEIHL